MKIVFVVLGNGMVIDPIGILEEINKLKELNIRVNNRIYIDYFSHIVTPIHKLIDRSNEAKLIMIEQHVKVLLQFM